MPRSKTKSPSKKKPQSQKPEAEQIDWPTFDTMQQCCSATGIQFSTLKKAKDGGCLAFRGGRIYFGEFIRWHFAQSSNTGEKFLDLEQQQARVAKEKADAMQEKRLKQQRESDFLTEVEEMLNEQIILPCRAWLTAAPSALAGRCNPAAPEVARKILSESFNKEFFPLMRSNLIRSSKGTKS